MDRRGDPAGIACKSFVAGEFFCQTLCIVPEQHAEFGAGSGEIKLKLRESFGFYGAEGCV